METKVKNHHQSKMDTYAVEKIALYSIQSPSIQRHGKYCHSSDISRLATIIWSRFYKMLTKQKAGKKQTTTTTTTSTTTIIIIIIKIEKQQQHYFSNENSLQHSGTN